MTDITAPAPVNGKSWFITGLGIGQIASWGSLYYSFPLVATAMEHDLGWDKTLIYGSATLGALLSALLAIPVGKAIDSGHGRLVMACSSVAAGFLLILWALTDNIVLFYLGSAGVGALQAVVLYEPAFAVIAVAAARAQHDRELLLSLSGAASPPPSSCRSFRYCSIILGGGGHSKSWRQ